MTAGAPVWMPVWAIEAARAVNKSTAAGRAGRARQRVGRHFGCGKMEEIKRIWEQWRWNETLGRRDTALLLDASIPRYIIEFENNFYSR